MASGIEEFKAAIRYFIEKTHLKNIKSITQNDMFFEKLLAGYAVGLSSGVAIYYSTKEVLQTDCDSIALIGSGESKQESHPFCLKYREPNCQDKQCIDFDKRIVMKYYKREWQKPALYQCHLHAWDMSFPIIISDNLLGVLFAGQIVVQKGSVKWREQLKEIINNPIYQVCWDPFDVTKEVPESSDPIEDIKNAISVQANEKYKNELMKFVDLCSEDMSSKPEEVVSRFKDFIIFGSMLIGLLNELYAAKKEAGERELIQIVSEYLSSSSISKRKDWWERCEKLLEEFNRIVHDLNIHVYTRKHSRFERWLPFPKEGSIPFRIQAKYVVPALKSYKLNKLAGNNNNENEVELLKQLTFLNQNIWAYKSETDIGQGNLGTLIIIHGDVRDEDYDIIDLLCRTICMRTDIAAMIFRTRDEQEAYKLNVAQVAHSFRMPLQTLLLDLRYLSRISEVAINKDTTERIQESEGRLYEAREDITAFLEGAMQRREDCNLMDIINRVFMDFKLIASSRPCELVKVEPWPNEILTHINKYQIRRAFWNLIDNAIKYSYGSRTVNGQRDLYKVRFSVNIDNEMAKITITNYGIGIPKEVLERVKEPGQRACVPDPKRERKGNGLGLPFAINAFRQHGGWMDINSYCPDDDPHEKGKEFHRYTTEIHSYLPIIEKELDSYEHDR